jgi:hypothetical protein
LKFFFSKRRVVAAAVILLALFTVHPGASRLKSRIIHSISAGLGRSVDIGSVHIRLLPRPAFDLENLVVYDDSGFGAEPMLRASQVTAALRLTSLLRGRLEIARLNLSEPSLNLVRGDSGHWNVEALLERSAHIPLAPTGKTKSEPRPAFPYIEGTTGRINFKIGPEKKPYALTNADFSLWQESENTWGVRLKAQPFRTDMNLNDTGLLQVNGTWERAEAMRETPLDITLDWSRAQLGQVTKLIMGNDKGWRGDILLNVHMKGSPAKLHITSSSSLEDFRRYDITSGTALRMSSHCDTDYSTETHEFRQIMCNAPVGDGLITVTGHMGFSGTHRYSLAITAEKVPAGGLVMLAQRLKKNVPEDLTGEGTVQAQLSIENDGTHGPEWKGRGEVADLHLTSEVNKAEIGPETLPFSVSNDPTGNGQGHKRESGRISAQLAAGPRLDIGPLAIGGSRPGSAMVRGVVTRSRYDFGLSGETEIGRVLRLARMAGMPAISSGAEGVAQLDLQIAGNWTVPGNGFAVPQVLGTAKLRNVEIAGRNAGAAAEIISAEMQLQPDAVHILKLNAKAAGTSWMGSMQLPRGCGTPDACTVQFSLNTNKVSLSDINEWVNPGSKKRPWYRVLGGNSDSRPAWWTTLHASGRITAERVQVHGIEATHVSSTVNLEDGRLRLSGLNADLLEGKHRGEWKLDFAKAPAVCAGTGNLMAVSLSAMASAMNDGWIAGTANAGYEVKGTCATDFWQVADGKLRIEVADGTFPHVMVGDGTEPLQASELNGEARLHGGKLEIADMQLTAPEGTYQLTGTASLNRQLDLKLTRLAGGPINAGYSIGGSLESPRVAPLSGAEQAGMKSLPTK